MERLDSIWTMSFAERADRPALIGGGESITYGELRRRVDRIASELGRVGVRDGVKVGLMFPIEPAFLPVFMAVVELGGVPCPLNPGSPPHELAPLLDLIRPDLIVASDATPGIRDRLPSPLGEPDDHGPGAGRGHRPAAPSPGARSRAVGRGVHPLHVGDHGIAEGRDAHARQPGDQPAGVPRPPAAMARSRLARSRGVRQRDPAVPPVWPHHDGPHAHGPRRDRGVHPAVHPGHRTEGNART